MAVDQAGDLFVTDMDGNRVLELPAGWAAPVELPFHGLKEPLGVAVDAVGDIYVADSGNDRVVKLPAADHP